MGKKSTKLFKDVLIAVPITIIYLLFINKIIDTLTHDMVAEERIKRTILISLIIGIVAIVIGIYVFGSSKLYNRPVKFSLVGGSTLLILYTLYYNWAHLQGDAKLFMLGGLFVVSIIWSYIK